MKQVDKDAYKFNRYVGSDRWGSYYYQLREIFACKPTSVLEIGVGNHIVEDVLKRHDIAYTSVDIADDLLPDVIASVTKLPFADNSFDVVCAFEVLEHMPFDQFEKALGEIARVTTHTALLSLPYFGPSLRGEFKMPFLPRIRFAWKIPYPKKHYFNGEHYWEIGKRGYSLRRIRRIIGKYFILEKEFVPFENQYHHFFILKKL